MENEKVTVVSDEMKNTTVPFHKYDWKPANNFNKDDNAVNFSIMEWNILAQRLCDGFDKIPDEAPILEFKNRLRLIKEHVSHVNPDLVVFCETDALAGLNAQEIIDLVKVMGELGYLS